MHLLVRKLGSEGGVCEIHNAPEEPVREVVEARPRPGSGQYQISLSRLESLLQTVPEDRKIDRVVPDHRFNSNLGKVRAG